MATFIMNSKKTQIVPVTRIKLSKVEHRHAVVVYSGEDSFFEVYETGSRGLAELVFDDLGRQIASGERLLKVCEPENRRMVEFSMDQLDYLMGLVEADEGKHEANTEGDYHLKQMQEQTIKVLGRYF